MTVQCTLETFHQFIIYAKHSKLTIKNEIYEGALQQYSPLSDDVRHLTPFATLQMQIVNISILTFR